MNTRVKDSGKTALLGGIGGLVGGGAKMLVEPALFKDQTAMKKWWFVTPLGEMVLAAIAGAFPKTALSGAGLAGAAIAHALENGNAAIAIKRNEKAAGTAGYGDLTEGLEAPPPALGAGVPDSMFRRNTGALITETGALVMNR